MHSKALAALALFVCLLLASAASAQESRGAIVGQVSDSGGGVIPGASVVITNTETGQTIKLVTNESGSYVAALLLLGNYQIEVPGSGTRTPIHTRGPSGR